MKLVSEHVKDVGAEERELGLFGHRYVVFSFSQIAQLVENVRIETRKAERELHLQKISDAFMQEMENRQALEVFTK